MNFLTSHQHKIFEQCFKKILKVIYSDLLKNFINFRYFKQKKSYYQEEKKRYFQNKGQNKQTNYTLQIQICTLLLKQSSKFQIGDTMVY